MEGGILVFGRCWPGPGFPVGMQAGAEGPAKTGGTEPMEVSKMRLALVGLLLCGPILAQETPALRLTVQDGAVTGVENRRTGETYTRPPGPSDSTSAMRVWDRPGSVHDARPGEDGVELSCQVNAEGEDLLVRQTGHREAGGVAGVWLGLGPVDAQTVRLLIPGVGGVVLDQDSKVVDSTYYYPGSWGTPAIALQGERGGVLVSADDPAASFKALRVTRLATAWRLLLLTDTDPPYGPRTDCTSATWRFTAYQGPWTVAADLQRDRLRRYFDLTPLAQRTPAWLPRIRCVVRVTGRGPAEAPLQTLAREVDPDRTLLYLPDWRTHPYDVMYPDYTPSPDAIEFIRAAHALGFRVMAHGNLVGISPFHPRLAEFEDVLERDPVSGAPVGWWLDRDVQSKIYCLNPAAAKARQLLVDSFVDSYRQAGFDALHLDFPLIINADGGPIEGRNPIQGTVALLRELQAALPGVPLGTEGIFDYMLDCSFGQVGEPFWNNYESQGRYHPFRAAIFSAFCNPYGHLGIPDQQTDLQAYLSFTEIHDRLGVLPTFTLNRDLGFDPENPGTRLALRQARHFLATEPVPDFAATVERVAAPGDPPATPYFAWRQADGERLVVVQTPEGRKWLTGGVNQPWRELWRIYQNVTRITGDLHLPGWLAYNDTELFGLDPLGIYLPEPGRPDPAAFHLAGASVPVRVSLCGSEERRDLIRVEAMETDVTDLLALRPDAVGIILDGGERPMGNGGTFSAGSTVCGGEARRGLYAHPPWQFPELQAAGAPIRSESFGEYRIKLPDVDDLRFVTALGLGDHTQPDGPAGDGVTFRVLINGQEVFSRHHDQRRWEEVSIDLTPWRGQEVVLRLLTGTGPAGRPDFDWAVWGQPRVASDPGRRQVRLNFVPSTAGGSLLIADAAGTRRLEPGTTTAEVALPAALVGLRDILPVEGPLNLAETPHGTVLVSGGVMTPGSVFGAGKPSAWTDGEQTRPGLSGHTPAWGQTHLEWALRLPGTPLCLSFGAGVNKGGEQLSFSVLVNGLPVWQGGWPGSGRMVEGRVDLTPYAGQEILLSLVTDAEGSNNCDWGVWVEPRLEAARE